MLPRCTYSVDNCGHCFSVARYFAYSSDDNHCASQRAQEKGEVLFKLAILTHITDISYITIRAVLISPFSHIHDDSSYSLIITTLQKYHW